MNTAQVLLAIFLCLCFLGALSALLLPQKRNPQLVACVGALAAIDVILLSGRILISGGTLQVGLWSIPELGQFLLSADRLSALFMLSAAIVFFAASIFSAGYLPRYLGHYSLRSFSILYLGLFASVILVLIADDVLSFLICWEAMSILSYLLVNFEHKRASNIHAGWLMLAMGETGTIAVAFALLLLASPAHSLNFAALPAASASFRHGMRWAVFLLSFLGFGVKAGLVPFSIWLPRAHPAAPANVSAVLSGVILNLGIYGIVRVNIDLLPVNLSGPGLTVLIIGSITALLGILYATVENDLKTLLAHSSIENMGLIVAALGAGFVFAAHGHEVLASIAFVAALYHMLNHSVYKALLFLGAGSIDMCVGTRNVNRLGGLMKAMPWTGFLFLIGALSIAALPPFNGFVSEWLILQSLLRSVELHSIATGTVFAFCAAALALTAGLAITCFVRAFGMSFLGLPRSPEAQHASEARLSMIVPMAGLALLCLIQGVTPTYMISALDRTLVPFGDAGASQALVPPFFRPAASGLPPQFLSDFHDLGAQVGQRFLPGPGLVVLHRGGERNPVVFAMSTSYMLVVLVLLLGASFLVVRFWLARDRRAVAMPPWDGGLQRLLPEMTYTATGFSSPVSVIFDAVLHPTEVEETRETIYAHFRTAIRRGNREEVHVLERVIFLPLAVCAAAIGGACAKLHNGRLNAYVSYILIVLLAVLLVS